MITPTTNLNTKTGDSQESVDQPAQPTELEKLAAQFPDLTEQQLKVRAWMLRDPGPRIEVEDDDIAFEEGV